ncbi:MAG: sulfur carrier protein ThiS [Kiritimatiellia bacterium]|jgi:sulfur carrier protein
MKIEVNDKEVELENNTTTIAALLVARNVKMPDMVSVELNGEILDRKTFAVTALKPGDKVEFLYFMGGGAPA